MRSVFQIGEQGRSRPGDLRRDERGQVMLLTALLSLVLVALPATVINVGQSVTDKMRLQTAADGAALTASTWSARGSNLLQGLNGMHWDFNVFIADAIIVCATVASVQIDAEIAEAIDDPFYIPVAAANIARIWKRANKCIKRLEDTQEKTAKAIEGTSEVVADTTPYLAYFHANKIAEKNSADLLDLSGFPFLGPIFQNIQNIIKPIRGISNIRIWTLSPSLWPPSALKFAHKQKSPAKHNTPYYTTSLNPFALCYEFARRPSWHDSYWLSDNKDKPVTFVVSRSRRRAYLLDKLLDSKRNTDGMIPPTYAVGAAKFFKDDLYPAGQKKTTYWCYPEVCVSLDPPVAGIPVRWTGLGKYHYGGNFECKLAPVEIMGVSGRNFLLFH